MNRTYHGRGDHAYRLIFNAKSGRHTYCVVAYNLGEGTTNPKRCRSVTVNGAPFGSFRTATVTAPTTVQLTGYAVDRSNTTASTKVQVYDGSKSLGAFPANVARSDVNSYYHIRGNHGFSISLPLQTPGLHSYRVYALNIGYAGPNVLTWNSPRVVKV